MRSGAVGITGLQTDEEVNTIRCGSTGWSCSTTYHGSFEARRGPCSLPTDSAMIRLNPIREMIDFINEAGIGAIGTPEDARAQVQRLTDQSGGFGAMLLLAHEWANPEATKRSYELIAQDVLPHF